METLPRAFSPSRVLSLAIASLALILLAWLAGPSASAQAAGKRIGLAQSSAVAPGPQARAKARAKAREAREARQRAKQAAKAASASALPPGTLLEAGFEQGLAGWNTAGVGEVIPSVGGGNVRTGAGAARVLLTGNLSRSELILGGDGGADTDGSPQFREGEEYWYGFSINIQQMVWGEPGAHNLFMQFKSDGEGSPNFGLDLWDYEGDDGESGGKGLWTEGDAMDGNRFLAPLDEGSWYDIAVHFRASSHGDGFYEVYLDGNLVDARSGVSMIVPGHSYGYIKNGLYRNGETAPGTSELLLDSAKLGTTQQAVTPS